MKTRPYDTEEAGMLKYIGDGSWLPGVPARDLTEDEIKQFGASTEALIKSGLYVKDQPHPQPLPVLSGGKYREGGSATKKEEA